MNIETDFPLDGRTLRTSEREWTLHVTEIEEPDQPHPTRWILHLQLASEGETLRLVAEVDDASIVVEHARGDVRWALDILQSWLLVRKPSRIALK